MRRALPCLLALLLASSCKPGGSAGSTSDLDKLSVAVRDPDPEISRKAAQDLANLGVRAKGAVPALTQSLQHPDSLTRYWVITTLHKIGPEARSALPEILKVLRSDPEPSVRAAAAKSMIPLEAPIEKIRETLEAALRDRSVIVRRNSRDALRKLDPGHPRELEGLYRDDEVPGEIPAPDATPEPPVAIGSRFQFFADLAPQSSLISWPRFRGPDFDGISADGIPLADKWGPGKPKLVWGIDLCDGHSGVVIHRGRFYVPDYDPKEQLESLRCFSLENGRELWRRSHQVKILNNHGFVHSIPSVSDDCVVSIGARGHMLCVNPISGDLLWSLDLGRVFGDQFRGFNLQSPLIDGTTIVFGVGAPDALLAGVSLSDGRILWKTPNPGKHGFALSSVLPMTLNGRRLYLYAASEATVVVSAEPSTAGQLLGEHPFGGNSYNVASPVPLEEGIVFLTSGYGRGGTLLRLSEAAGSVNVSPLWTRGCKEGLSSEAHPPIYYQRHLYAILPADAGTFKHQFVCMDPHDQGKIVWSSGKNRRFGMYEPFLLADGRFYVMGDDGCLTMIRASAEAFTELATVKIFEKHGGWSPAMAIAGGRLLVRSDKRLVCVDLTQ